MNAVVGRYDVVPIAIAEMAAVMMNDIVMVAMVNNIIVTTVIVLGICRSGREQHTATYQPTENLKSCHVEEPPSWKLNRMNSRVLVFQRTARLEHHS